MSGYGYIVELGDGRTMASRLDAMRGAGVPSGSIVVETPGRAEDRPQLRRLLSRVRPGDTLTFESIYGLGHNYSAIARNLEQIERRGEVCVVLLDFPLMREYAEDDPQRAAVSHLVVQTALYMVRHQQEVRETRQRRGVDSAKARGVQFGRPKLTMPSEFDALVEHWRNGDITAEDAARLMNISRSTFFRRMKANSI